MTVAVLWLLLKMDAPWWVYLFIAAGFLWKLLVLSAKGEEKDDIR